MPEISRFFGIRILMFYNDHAPPHFHGEYSGERVSIEIGSLTVMEGSLPRRALGMVIEWAGAHQDELAEDWRRSRMGLPLLAIRPLE